MEAHTTPVPVHIKRSISNINTASKHTPGFCLASRLRFPLCMCAPDGLIARVDTLTGSWHL